MKKIVIVLASFMVLIGVTGCGEKSQINSEDIQDIQLTTDSVYTDVEAMSTEVSEISKSVEEIKDSINNSSQEEVEKYKKKAKNLQTQLDKMTEEKEALETSKTPKYQEYIDAVFPKNGTYVLREGSEVQFYSDVTCTKEELETPKFSSSMVNDSAVDKNNRRPHSLRTTDDRIVYCVDWPDLVDEANN